MPIYEYECDKCGHGFEREQRMSDAPVKTCPSCKSRRVKKLISLSSFSLKGGGWYADGYADTKKAKDEKESKDTSSPSDDSSSSDGDSTKKSDAKSDTQSDAKSGTKSDAKTDAKSTNKPKGGAKKSRSAA